MQEGMLEVRLKDSTIHVNSEWMGNLLNEHGISQNNAAFAKSVSASGQHPSQQSIRKQSSGSLARAQNARTLYTPASQASQPI